MRDLALFAGAGGGVLAGHLLGWRTVCAVEVNAYCRSVLLARQRDGMLDPFPIWDDVRTFDGHAWRGSVDVVSGGFPCQDISDAGECAGIDGERSGLWREYARIIREVRPRFIIVENVAALLHRGIWRVLGDLAACGYDAEWQVLSAAAFGAPHLRERVFIVAYHRSERIQGIWTQPIQRQQAFSWCQDVRRIEDIFHRSDIPEPLVCGNRNGIPAYMDRIKRLGNAVVPQVAEYVGRCIMAAEAERQVLA